MPSSSATKRDGYNFGKYLGCSNLVLKAKNFLQFSTRAHPAFLLFQKSNFESTFFCKNYLKKEQNE